MSNETPSYINDPSQLVSASGPKDAKIMIIGEAPGEHEVKQNKPFVGASGDLLNKSLIRVGIDRDDCYVTNVVKERPKGNNIDPWLDLSKRTPKESSAYRAYRDRLKEEIEEVNPNLIIAVGAVPLWTLCNQKGILKWRGSILESTLVPGKKVLPIIHPAAALRQYIYRYWILFDLQRAVDQSAFPELQPDGIEYLLRPSFKETLDYLDKCSRSSLVAFDIEVASGEVSCISLACSEKSVISIPFTEDGKDYFVIPQEVEVWKQIAAILENPNIEKLAQNASFDVTFLYRKYGIRTRPVHDTMIGHAIIYPEFPKGLDFITSIYTNLPYYKDEGKSRIEAGIKGINAVGGQEAFWLYNAKDSVALMQAWPRIQKQLRETGNWNTYERQRRLIEPFLFMTERGVRMDTIGLQSRSEEASEEIDECLRLAEDIVGEPINLGSTQQLQEYFYDRMRIKPYISRSTGNPTTDEKAMKRLASKGGEVGAVAQIVLKYRKVKKLDSTYYNVKLDSDGRLRTSIKIVGTKFGRVSSSKTIFGTGANMQNQPRSMKKYMLVDEGYMAYEMDLGQAENRVVAWIAHDPNMMEAFETGADIHSLTAASVADAFGVSISPDEVIAMEKLYKQTKKRGFLAPIGNGLHTWRDWGKKANHGLNYGMEAAKAALLWEVKRDVASVVVDRYHATYPAIRRWHSRIRNQLGQTRILENLFGRKVRFYDRWGNDLFLAAYSFIPQSTVADQMNQRGVFHIYDRQDLYGEVELLMQVHDSVVFQIPVSAGFDRHAEILVNIHASLTSPLTTAEGIEFSIPSDVKVLPKNFLEGEELEIPSFMSADELASALEEIHRNAGA